MSGHAILHSFKVRTGPLISIPEHFPRTPIKATHVSELIPPIRFQTAGKVPPFSYRNPLLLLKRYLLLALIAASLLKSVLAGPAAMYLHVPLC